MKRYLILAVLAGLGLAALVQVFPETDDSARWGFALSREQAVVRARAAALGYGVDASQWTASASATVAYRREWQLRRIRNQAIRTLAAPAVIRVLLGGGKAGAVQVELDATGGLRGFVHRGSSRAPAQETAERAAVVLADFAGPHANAFRLATDGVPHAEGTRFTYEYRDRKSRFVVLRFEVTLRGGQPVQAGLAAEFFGPPARLVQRWEVSRQMISAILLAVGVVAVFLVMPVFFRSVVRKRISLGLPAAAGATVFLMLAAAYFGGPGFQEARWAAFGDTPGLVRSALLALLGKLLIGVLLAVFLGAALGLAGPETRRAWYSLGLLFSRGAFSRAVGLSVLAGLLAGAALSPLPHLAARLIASVRAAPPPREPDLKGLPNGGPRGGPGGGFRKGPMPGSKAGPPGSGSLLAGPPASLMRLTKPSDLMAPVPVLGLANGLPYWQLVLLFAMLFPFTDPGGWARQFTRPWLRWTLVLMTGVLVCGLLALFFAPGLAPNFLMGLILTGVWSVIYLKIDLLAVLTAELAMSAIWFAGAALNQPAPGLAWQGWFVITLLGLVAGAALAAMLAGRRTDAEAFIAAQAAMAASERSSDRERLDAEFDLARRAQQSLLRPVEPAAGRLALAASCTPALQVGGDLYAGISILGLPDPNSLHQRLTPVPDLIRIPFPRAGQCLRMASFD
ncbi:MAG: hypothetical protein FJW40_22015, partial [Acidobacteria bacterium]|nr:hypothetical protein [Acidobacteriota bacterium]